MVDFLKHRMISSLISVALVIVGLQTITPLFIDLVFDAILVGFIFLAARFAPRKEKRS